VQIDATAACGPNAERRSTFVVPVIYSPAQRCLDVLELLADAPDGLALSGVASRLGLPKSATHRFLAILAGRGFVRQDAATGHYALTLKLPALGFRLLSGRAMPDLAQPALDRLAACTGELARLALVEDDTLTWVAKAQGASSGLRYDADAGRAVILHATATGKAWLATLDETQALALVEREGRLGTPGFGPRAVATPAALRRELRATRKRGWGEAVEEGEPGVAAIAVALRPRGDPTAPACATLSIAGPLARMDAARRCELAREAFAAAREIEDLWPAHAPRSVAAAPARDGPPRVRGPLGGSAHSARRGDDSAHAA
jgi:DNA-binding IclR family transcriptional regulator